MISKDKAIELARAKIAGLDFVDPLKIEWQRFHSRDIAIADGVGDTENLHDEWLICFKRLDTGRSLDGVFDSLMVVVDAKTGDAEIQESL